MNQTLRKTVIHSFGAAGLFPTTLTSRQEVTALIQKLHPIRSDKPLIRLGPQGDGGYLVPDDLAGIEACFSPGVSYVSGFEKACADRGMQVFMADKSVDGPADSHPNFHFVKKYIGAITTPEFMTMDGWVNASVPDSRADLLLQIDIEGYEYETILSMSDTLMQRFRIITGEFHSLHLLWSQPFFKLAARAFEKILQTHACVHIHPNNECETLAKGGLQIPRLMEFTFVRRDRQTGSTFATEFPHTLDSDNARKNSTKLPRCWYASQAGN